MTGHQDGGDDDDDNYHDDDNIDDDDGGFSHCNVSKMLWQPVVSTSTD